MDRDEQGKHRHEYVEGFDAGSGDIPRDRAEAADAADARSVTERDEMDARTPDEDAGATAPSEATEPTTAEEVGEAAGGISGVLAGATLGAMAGPVGSLLGGLAGAVGGWWAGRAIAEAAEHYTDQDDERYRAHYESSPNRLADHGYEDVRPAYQLGHIASLNPAYWPREFEEIEPELQTGWTEDLSARHGSWPAVRPYAREGYTRARALGRGPTASESENARIIGDSGEEQPR